MSLHIPGPAEPVSLILKLPGEVCNINCSYCYEKRKPAADIKKFNAALLSQVLAKAGDRPLAIELHGGEPLLIGINGMRAILQTLRAHSAPIKLSVQTNGTLLSQAWIDLFRDEWPEIGLATSLDGDPTTNAFRVDYRNEPTITKVEAAFELLEKNGMRIGVISTVTTAALGRERDILDYFRQFRAINQIKFNPCFDFGVAGQARDVASSDVPSWGITPLQFESFLRNVFKEWRASGLYKTIAIEPFMSIIRVLGGKRASFCVYDEHKCANILTLYPDGRLTSCDELNGSDAQLGHVDDICSLDEILPLQTNPKLKQGLDKLLEKCVTCTHRNTCKGGCLATRKRYWGTPYYEEYCDYRQGLIDFVGNEISAKIPIEKNV